MLHNFLQLNFQRLFWISVFFALIPWLIFYHDQAVHIDIGWLTICAQRLLNGKLLYHDYYEINPPLIVLIQTIPIALSNALHIPLVNGLFLFPLSLVFLSAFLLRKTLSYIQTIKPEFSDIYCLIFIISVTAIPSVKNGFGQREHLIILGIIPFLTLQFALLNDIKIPKYLKYSILIFGSIAILIKPPYGFLPCLMFFAKSIKQRSLIKTIQSSDFIVLTAITFFYCSIVLIYFPVYLSHIIPEIINIYSYWAVDMTTIYLTLLNFGFLFVILTPFFILFLRSNIAGKDIKILVIYHLIAACISIIIFVLQKKGVFNHIYPAIVFSALGICFPLFFAMKKYVQNSKINQFSFGVLLLLALYIILPRQPGYLSHQEFLSSDIMRFIQEHTKEGDSIYSFYDRSGIIMVSSLYRNHHWASRFPIPWFISPTIHFPNKDMQDLSYEAHFKTLMVEDLNKHKPKLVFIPDFSVKGWPKNMENFKFTEYLMGTPSFRDIWSHYTRIGQYKIEYKHFFLRNHHDEITIYDVYLRTD